MGTPYISTTLQLAPDLACDESLGDTADAAPDEDACLSCHESSMATEGEDEDTDDDEDGQSIASGDDQELALEEFGQDQDDGQDAIQESDVLSAGAIARLSASEGPSLPASPAVSIAHVAAGAARPRRGGERPSYREARSYRQGGSRGAPAPPEGQPGAHGPSG